MDSGVLSVFMYGFFPSFDLMYFHVGKAVVLLEEGARKVLHLMGLK